MLLPLRNPSQIICCQNKALCLCWEGKIFICLWPFIKTIATFIYEPSKINWYPIFLLPHSKLAQDLFCLNIFFKNRIQETLNLLTFADSKTNRKKNQVSGIACHLSHVTAGCSCWSWPRPINKELQRLKKSNISEPKLQIFRPMSFHFFSLEGFFCFIIYWFDF